MMAAPEEMTDNIRKFEEIGTHPAANHNAISDALEFHQTIGVERKAARLRYLRSIWTERLTQIAGVSTPTSSDPRMSCGIGMLSVSGKPPGPLRPALGQVPHSHGRHRPQAVSRAAYHAQYLHHGAGDRNVLRRGGEADRLAYYRRIDEFPG